MEKLHLLTDEESDNITSRITADRESKLTKKQAQSQAYVEGSTVPLKTKNSISPHYNPSKNSNATLAGNADLTLINEKSDGTHGTDGTINTDDASDGSTIKNHDGTNGTIDLNGALNPVIDAGDIGQLEAINFDDLDTPCFVVKDDWFLLDGGKRKSGVYWCYQTEGSENKDPANIAQWICSPLHIDGVSNTEDGRYFGRLLRFQDTLGRWRKWAMPMELLRGSCEELRGELLAAGVLIDTRNRAKIPEYLQYKTPKEVITAATRTGWSQSGKSFVLHDAIIGDEKIFFQSENLNQDGVARSGGNYREWQNLAALCIDNPVLIVSVCVSFAGALIVKTHQDSGGVHWLGDSSIGKSTALMVGCSVWGDDKFKRTWRATSNGLEGIAALLSDTCLCLDEINEADPREIGAIVYSLGNGTGKTRANRVGSARGVHRWRLSLLSTGERSVSTLMHEGGKQAKSGQLVRLLNIPATRAFGVFDNLHHFEDGRAMADFFKTHTAKHYGYAGVKFIEHLISLGDYDYCKRVAELETRFIHKDTQAARVASRFALYALAGELAIEAGIVPWAKDTAINACIEMFNQWVKFRGDDSTEHTQILKAVADYILKFGDTKFTNKSDDCPPKLDRSGWYTDRSGERVYLFSSAGLKEAGGGFDFDRVLVALDNEGWIVERDHGVKSKKTSIKGGAKHRLYWILPKEESLVPSVPSSKNIVEPTQAPNTKAVPSVPPVPSQKTKVDVKNDFVDAELI